MISAGLIFWFCCGKRNLRRGRNFKTNALVTGSFDKEPTTELATLEDRKTASANIDSILALPLEDRTITGEISKISNLIKNHVQSFYHNSRVATEAVEHYCLRRLDLSIPVTSSSLGMPLTNPTTREVALRFCIALVIISRMQTQSADCFLLPELVVCMKRISQATYTSDGESHCKGMVTKLG